MKAKIKGPRTFNVKTETQANANKLVVKEGIGPRWSYKF